MSLEQPKQRAVSKVLTYVWEYQTYTKALRTDTRNLKAKLSNVQKDVEDARSNHQDIKQQVIEWLDEGNKEVGIIESFLDSLFPSASCWKLITSECNCKHRYAVATRAESYSKQIKTLIERCSFEGGVSLELKPPPLTPTMKSTYKTIPSREKYIERIMEALLDGNKFVIGVYGLEDVGKTMLIMKLALAIESSGQFNNIAITGDWGDTGLFSMQSCIAEMIGFNLLMNSVVDRARLLNDELRRIGKVVLIIDNVGKRLDLNKIGIPSPDKNNGCRIVVASKSLDVCKEMSTHLNLEIEPLCQEEALHLFDKLANEYNFIHTTSLQQARESILSKFIWLPGEIGKLLRTFRHKLVFPTKSAVVTYRSSKKTLMLGAEALDIKDIEKVPLWRWLNPSASTSSLNVAEVIRIQFLHISMAVREEWLSPATNYGAYFVYQLTSRAKGFNNTPVEIAVGSSAKTCYLDLSTAATKMSEGGGAMPKRRVDGWLEIELGSFFSVGHSTAVVALRVEENKVIKTGLLVQGFELRPLA